MYWIIIVLCVVLDQISKAAVDNSMALGQTIDVLPGVFDLTYIHNEGAAFSILLGKQSLLIAITSMLMIAMTLYVIKQGKAIFKPECISVALIVGGGLGNLISRAMSGYVIDFLNIYILPVFNVADIFVCCGCGLLMLSVLFLEPRALKKAAEKKDE